MALLDTIRTRIKSATLGRREKEKNVLKVVLGEAQTLEARNGSVTDDQVTKIVRKIVESNLETIGLIVKGAVSDYCAAQQAALDEENEILESLLPKMWTASEIEKFFLNGDNSGFNQIIDCKNDGQAVGVAMKALKAAGAPVDGKIVGDVVRALRSTKA